MIKFYKGDSTALATKKNDTNSICFLTDTLQLYMGGKAYGKDQFKVGELATISGGAQIGDYIFNTTDNKLYKKTGDSATSAVVDFPAIAATSVATLEAKLSNAFAANKVVLGTATGITSSNFEPDTTAGTLDIANSTAADLSSTLVNAATLKTQIASVNSSKATLTGGNGIAVSSGDAAGGGIQWTIAADILTGSSISSSLKFDSNGKLIDSLKIEKLASTTAGYAASYALKTGDGVQLGDTINVVKDQFLNSATIVTGHMDGNTFVSGSAATDHKFIKLTFNVNSDGNNADVETGAVSDIYLDVNDLVDVYTGASGVYVDSATNKISGVIDTAHNTEGYLTLGADGFAVTGVDAAISTAIQGLSSKTAVTDQYVTAFGVDASGKLTGTTAQVSAGQVAFTAITSSNTTVAVAGTDVAAAIASLGTAVKTAENNALTGANAAITAAINTLTVAAAGGTGKYITTISESSGKISATAETLDASKVAYGTDSTVSAALTGIADQISKMDLTAVGGGSVPTSAGAKYSIINTVSQTDGQVAASPIDLTAGNTYQAGVTEALTSGTTGSAAQVGITAGTVQEALVKISNLIADYGSFHDKDDKLV